MRISNGSEISSFGIRSYKSTKKKKKRKRKKKQAHLSRDKVMPKDAERARLHIWFVPAENRIREETN